VLFVVDGEKQVLAIGVTAVDAVSLPVEVNVAGLRQPHVEVPLAEVDWAVFDHGAVGIQANRSYGSDQIGFQSYDLIAVGGNPGAAFDRYRVGLTLGSGIASWCSADPVRRFLTYRRTNFVLRLLQALSSQHSFVIANFATHRVSCCAPPHHPSTPARLPSPPFMEAW
jgi:hypothetical protein